MEAMEMLLVLLIVIIFTVGMFVGGGWWVISKIIKGIKWLFSKKS